MLRNQNLMDYSLLLGVGSKKKKATCMDGFIGEEIYNKEETDQSRR